MNPKVFYIFDKPLILSIVCSKFGENNNKIFKEKESTDILKKLV